MSKRSRNRDHNLLMAQQGQPQQPSQRITQVHQQWTGPLPPPEALARFNEIVPDGANRIMVMAEAEQRHRMEYESRGLVATTSEAKRGQILGTILSALCIAGAVATAYIGAHWSVPVALVGVPLLSVIRAVINRRGVSPKTDPNKK